jgi:hypothetical protein
VRRLAVVTCLAFALAVAPASADALLPPAGGIFAGLTGGGGSSVDAFAATTGSRPAVYQSFTTWGQASLWAFRRAARAGARPMLHISTITPSGGEVTTVGAIARGAGDGYLVALNRVIEDAGVPTYLRLMAEMDGHWNPYCAYGPDGRSRGRDRSTAAFRQAWRRTVIVVRGGSVDAMNTRLRKLGMPALRTDATELARVPVAFQWVPQVAGAPDTAANAPRAYWPGAEYVDWVGTDFYSKFPNFSGLERFYREFAGKPFVFGEWAMWGRDDPAFVRRLFAWIRSHKTVRMVVYNQGDSSSGPFRLGRFPRAAAALRDELSSPRFVTAGG